MQNIYAYERLVELTEQERALERRHAQQLREVGAAESSPRTWLAAVIGLLVFLRLN